MCGESAFCDFGEAEARKDDAAASIGASVFADVGWDVIDVGVVGATVVANGLELRDGFRFMSGMQRKLLLRGSVECIDVPQSSSCSVWSVTACRHHRVTVEDANCDAQQRRDRTRNSSKGKHTRRTWKRAPWDPFLNVCSNEVLVQAVARSQGRARRRQLQSRHLAGRHQTQLLDADSGVSIAWPTLAVGQARVGSCALYLSTVAVVCG